MEARQAAKVEKRKIRSSLALGTSGMRENSGMTQTSDRLVGLRALRSYLATRIGDIALSELRALAASGAIPSIRLRGTDGRTVHGFSTEAVDASLKELARVATTRGKRAKGGAQ